MVRNSLRSFRVLSLAGLLTLTLGLGGMASAHSSTAASGVLAPQQETATATPLNIDQLVPLTFGKEASSPIDNDQIGYRNFSFKGKANQLVTVSSKVLTGNLSLKVYVYSQGDTEIGYAEGTFVTATTLTVKLPQDGNYKVYVREADPGAGDFTAGTFSVMVADATTATTNAAASAGSVAAATTSATISATAAATPGK